MVNSVSGGSASGLMAALMKEAAARQNLEVSVVKKGQEIEKMQGDSALKLIEAAANLSEPGKIDVRV